MDEEIIIESEKFFRFGRVINTNRKRSFRLNSMERSYTSLDFNLIKILLILDYLTEMNVVC
jgi:hypothetical protein